MNTTYPKSSKAYLHQIALAISFLIGAQGNSLGQTSAPSAMSASQDIHDEAKTNWVTSASLGLSLTRGNSKTLLVAGNILTERKWGDKNELRLGADANYGEDDDVKNSESIH